MSAITQVAVNTKKRARSDDSESREIEDQDEAPVEAEQVDGGTGTPQDGLAFWVATKTMAFKMGEVEIMLKTILHNAGFSTEECSVRYNFSFIRLYHQKLFGQVWMT